MRVLIDMVHPAHVHFYRHLIENLSNDGHDCLVTARDKEVSFDLLDAFEIPYRPIGAAGRKSMPRLAAELIARDIALYRIGRKFRPDVILARNPAGVQAARALRTTGVFDTDDGAAVGIHFRAAAPFATYIATPAVLREDYGRKHARYPGFKELAYLHPDHFRPDPAVRAELGVRESEDYSIARFVAFGASHDTREQGFASDAKRKLISELHGRGRVFISSEDELSPDLEPHRLRIRPERIHHALAGARVCVGDSQTVAREAAIIGTPTIYVSSFAGRLDVMTELADRFELIRAFEPTAATDAIAASLALVDDDTAQERWATRRDDMLAATGNVSKWYEDFVLRIGTGR